MNKLRYQQESQISDEIERVDFIFRHFQDQESAEAMAADIALDLLRTQDREDLYKAAKKADDEFVYELFVLEDETFSEMIEDFVLYVPVFRAEYEQEVKEVITEWVNDNE